MEPEVPCSQEPTTGRCPEPAESSEYADSQYIHGFCDGNSKVAVDECRGRFPSRLVTDTRDYLLHPLLYRGAYTGPSITQPKDLCS
jgi:hypothetical protein